MSHEVPNFIWYWIQNSKVEPIEACRSLEWAGRTLTFIRMVADNLETPIPGRRTIAEYHSYTGMSAALASLDATATWLNEALHLGHPDGNRVSLAAKRFVASAVEAIPEIGVQLESLGKLRGWINEDRRLIQHRRGARLNFHPYGSGWCFESNDGPSEERLVHCHLHDLLRNWGNQIEPNLELLTERIPPTHMP